MPFGSIIGSVSASAKIEELLSQTWHHLSPMKPIRQWCQKFGPDIRTQAQETTRAAGGYLAHRRSVCHDPRPAPVSLACRGPRRRYRRYSRTTLGATKKRSGNASFAAYSKTKAVSPTGSSLTNCEAMMRLTAPTMPTVNHHQSRLCQQPRGSVAPTHAATRIFICEALLRINSSATVSDAAWTHSKSLSPWPPPHAGGQSSTITSAGVSGLEGSGVCMRDGGIARRVHPILVTAR